MLSHGLFADGNKVRMKELEENTIEQIRTLLNYLEQTDLLKNKEILRCLDVIARELWWNWQHQRAN